MLQLANAQADREQQLVAGACEVFPCVAVVFAASRYQGVGWWFLARLVDARIGVFDAL